MCKKHIPLICIIITVQWEITKVNEYIILNVSKEKENLTKIKRVEFVVYR